MAWKNSPNFVFLPLLNPKLFTDNNYPVTVFWSIFLMERFSIFGLFGGEPGTADKILLPKLSVSTFFTTFLPSLSFLDVHYMIQVKAVSANS